MDTEVKKVKEVKPKRHIKSPTIFKGIIQAVL